MGKADLHIHSTYSDGYESIPNILTFVEQFTDLEVIAITDHDCIDGALLARDLMAKQPHRLEVIVGAEISTADGHLLALYIEHLIPAQLSMQDTIQAIHEQGGLAVVAHPLSHWCPAATLKTLISLTHTPDGLEVHNASWAGLGSNRKIRLANRDRFHWAELGGSDAHSLSAIGSGYTLFPGCSAEEVLNAIRKCTTQAQGSYWSKKAMVQYVQGKVQHRFSQDVALPIKKQQTV